MFSFSDCNIRRILFQDSQTILLWRSCFLDIFIFCNPLLANFLLLLSTQNPQKALGTSVYFMSAEGCVDSGRDLKSNLQNFFKLI